MRYSCVLYVCRVDLSHSCMRSGLSTSRSIGDRKLKKPSEIVSAVPDVNVTTIDFRYDDFVILGSDGVWDFVTDQEACDIVGRALDDSASAQEVMYTKHRIYYTYYYVIIHTCILWKYIMAYTRVVSGSLWCGRVSERTEGS